MQEPYGVTLMDHRLRKVASSPGGTVHNLAEFTIWGKY
jgi:hypothetical protein